MTLTGKTALVTGVSSGIEEATARLLAQQKCNVALAARREDRLNSLAAELGEGVLAVPTDVTDPAACEDLVSRADKSFGSVDILVANAGLGLYGSIAEGEPEGWRRMFEANVSFPRAQTITYAIKYKQLRATFPRSALGRTHATIRSNEGLAMECSLPVTFNSQRRGGHAESLCSYALRCMFIMQR